MGRLSWIQIDGYRAEFFQCVNGCFVGVDMALEFIFEGGMKGCQGICLIGCQTVDPETWLNNYSLIFVTDFIAEGLTTAL